MNEPIWEGIHKDFSELAVAEKGFSGQTWISGAVKKTQRALDTLEGSKPIVECGTSLLPFLVSVLAAEKSSISILDYGGSTGLSYVQVLSCLADHVSLAYNVVEFEAVCVAGRRLFADDPRITFHASLPQDPFHVDVVYMGSSLHYAPDWRGLLRQLMGYEPRYVLLADLPAGTISTYASLQRYHDDRIPVWFFDREEVLEVMRELNYALQFQCQHRSVILGKEQPMPQDNFPEAYRLGHTCNLLFHRENVA